MLATQYLSIDKKIISLGMKYDFNIYQLLNDHSSITSFKPKGFSVTSNDKAILENVKTLYVQKSEHSYYKLFCEAHLANVPKDKFSNFLEKAGVAYAKASKLLDELFDNPQTLANYKSAKVVVNDLVDTVLDEKFTITSLMSIAAHDYCTKTHSINVAIYALALGSFLGLSSEELSELGEAALLHDLGKSQIDPKIINKKGRLTDAEFTKAKNHSSLSYSLALKLGITNQKILLGIRHHHEKMDGAGYPSGLKQNQIPLYARIIGLCDIFDAITSERSYKEALSTFEALKLLKTRMKTHVDTKLLDQMILMFKN